MIGILGGLDVFFDWYVYFFFGIILTALIYANKSSVFMLEKSKLLILFSSVFGTIASIMLAMYLYATPVGNFVVNGLQGRYFIVLLPPFVWLVSELRHRYKRRFDIFIFGIIILSILKSLAGWYF